MKRLWRAFVAVGIASIFSALYSAWLVDFLSTPLIAKLPSSQRPIFSTVTATFTTPLKLSFLLGLIITMPYVQYQVWSFVRPRLYRNERRFARPLLVWSILLFYIGMMFAYFLVFPLVFRFFVTAIPQTVQLMADTNNYIKFTLTLFLVFGLAFETPVAITLLVLANAVSLEKLRKTRGYALIIAFVIAAILTPPDVMSQTGVAVPIYLLYEVGIVIASLVTKNRRRTIEF